jgi:hypothetical protein
MMILYDHVKCKFFVYNKSKLELMRNDVPHHCPCALALIASVNAQVGKCNELPASLGGYNCSCLPGFRMTLVGGPAGGNSTNGTDANATNATSNCTDDDSTDSNCTDSSNSTNSTDDEGDDGEMKCLGQYEI